MDEIKASYPQEDAARSLRGAAGESSRPRKRGAIRRLFRAVQRAITVTAIVLALLVFTPLGDWHASLLLETAPPAEADYILVLSGQFERAVEAARLYREGWAKKVIFSTMPGGPERYAAVAEAYGLPREAMIFDEKATRTHDHPRTVAGLPGVHPDSDRFLLVTSPFHTSRAAACFRPAGYRHIRAVGIGWRTGGQFSGDRSNCIRRGYDLTEKIYETLAWGLYALRGWV